MLDLSKELVTLQHNNGEKCVHVHTYMAKQNKV